MVTDPGPLAGAHRRHKEAYGHRVRTSMAGCEESRLPADLKSGGRSSQSPADGCVDPALRRCQESSAACRKLRGSHMSTPFRPASPLSLFSAQRSRMTSFPRFQCLLPKTSSTLVPPRHDRVLCSSGFLTANLRVFALAVLSVSQALFIDYLVQGIFPLLPRRGIL